METQPDGAGEVIDRRGAGPGLGQIGVGGGGIVVIIILLINLLGGGGDLGGLVDVLQPAGEVETGANPIDPANDRDADLVRFLEDVLQDTQSMWVGIFEEADLSYRPANLIVFSGFTQSSCGGAQAQSGPHYCPADEQVYMDLELLGELQRRFGAAGDTAQAYILAHEIAHHVQLQLGITEEAQSIGSNEAGIALELQADCLAGIWLSTLRTGSSAAVLEENDLQEALNAAAAVGDDAIQSQTTGQVNPSHGRMAARNSAINGSIPASPQVRPGSCDTFGET